MLEDPWGLGLAEEAGREVVEGVAPADDYIGCHGGVEFKLVEAGSHVGFGEVRVERL